LYNSQQALCGGLITEIKAFKAFKAFKEFGTNGLTTEFLKYFWPDLKAFICPKFFYAFVSDSLSISQ